MLVGTCSNRNFSHLHLSEQFSKTTSSHRWGLIQGSSQSKTFQNKTHKHKQFKNEQVPKSPWKTMDRKGANTFPFYNLPPVLRNISKKVFSVLFPFPLLDEIKVGGDSCLPRHFVNTKRKTSINSRFFHRIIELETLLGKYYKSGVTLGFRSHLFSYIVWLVCFTLWFFV